MPHEADGTLTARSGRAFSAEASPAVAWIQRLATSCCPLSWDDVPHPTPSTSPASASTTRIRVPRPPRVLSTRHRLDRAVNWATTELTQTHPKPLPWILRHVRAYTAKPRANQHRAQPSPTAASRSIPRGGRKRPRPADPDVDSSGETELMLPHALYYTQVLGSAFHTARFAASGGLSGAKPLSRQGTNQLRQPVVNPASKNKAYPVHTQDLMFTIQVYDRRKKAGPVQEFQVLGSNRLTALRDRIYCLCDHTPQAKERVSSYFFFGSTCFDDMRDPRAVSLSLPVREWAAANSDQGGWGLIQGGDMHDTRFGDVELSVGAHYLYCHQGDCEHIVIVTDVRQVTSSDPGNWFSYPVHTYQATVEHRMCSVCLVEVAAFICYGDRNACTNPDVFCERCYNALHYSAEGELLYSDFSVFPYYHEYK